MDRGHRKISRRNGFRFYAGAATDLTAESTLGAVRGSAAVDPHLLFSTRGVDSRPYECTPREIDCDLGVVRSRLFP